MRRPRYPTRYIYLYLMRKKIERSGGVVSCREEEWKCICIHVCAKYNCVVNYAVILGAYMMKTLLFRYFLEDSQRYLRRRGDGDVRGVWVCGRGCSVVLTSSLHSLTDMGRRVNIYLANEMKVRENRRERERGRGWEREQREELTRFLLFFTVLLEMNLINWLWGGRGRFQLRQADRQGR